MKSYSYKLLERNRNRRKNLKVIAWVLIVLPIVSILALLVTIVYFTLSNTNEISYNPDPCTLEVVVCEYEN